MEDYNSNLLNDSKNEWSIRLMNVLSGHIIDGFRSIFNEALELCEQNEEPEKYLMTFQNFLSRIPKWNQNMIESESQRIIVNSKCNYLEDLITCVHIVQLKILSCVRTSNHNQKIEIDMPSLTGFLHNVYINIARKLYSNIYLFQVDVSSLEQQKNNREFELIVQACIMNTIRDNIPIDVLLGQYIDETQEVDIERKEKIIKKEELPPLEETQKTPEVQESKQEHKQEHKQETPSNDNVSFSENVEKYDPVNNVSTTIPITSTYDQEQSKPTLNIENNVSLLDFDNLENVDENNNDKYDDLSKDSHTLNIDDTPIQLSFDTFDDNQSELESDLDISHKNDIIDLNATELDL
jgi:hypothetical protein